MDNKTMAICTAKNLVRYLNAKGVKCSSDFVYEPIRKVLRGCWYVYKLLNCGRTDCIHIDLDCGSFIAITDDCKIMSGFHVMIHDAIESIYLEYVDSECGNEPYDTLRRGRARFYTDEGGDNGMLLMDPFMFRRWIDSLTFYERTDEESEELL